MSNRENKPLMPKLRFSAFKNSPEWTSEKVDRLVDTVTPPKKLPTSSYAVKGDFPIIDQSQNAICGWTDDREALIQDDLPLIIFGDHTCILKLLDRPFAQGADGIKILKPRPRIGTSYLYQYLSYRPVVTEEYKRHYSILKEKVVLFPDFKTGEQQKIADCLSSLDELIVAQARKVNALKTHKKGLMQQLFPREGETQPRLRFPEFRGAGEWEEKRLEELCETISSGKDKFSQDGAFDLYGSTGIIGRTNVDSFRGTYILIARVGANAGFLTKATGEFGVTDNTLVIMLKKGQIIDLEFIFFYLHQIGLNKMIFGSGQPLITGGQLKALSIQLPTEREQQRIADCLTSLDTLITTATQELETLKTHKKGLMQQLFPSAEAVAA